MSGEARRKILFSLDIDYTLCANDSEDPDPWIGGPRGKALWKDFDLELRTWAALNNIELHLAIITNKKFADDLVFSASRVFQESLDLNHGHSHFDDTGHLLVSLQSAYQDELGQICLLNPTGENSDYWISTQFPPGPACLRKSLEPLHSSKIIIFQPGASRAIEAGHEYSGFKNKAEAILSIAERFNIPPHECYHLDDRWDILRSIQAAGMRAISAACFALLSNKFSQSSKEFAKELDKEFAKELVEDPKGIHLKKIRLIHNNIRKSLGMPLPRASEPAASRPESSLTVLDLFCAAVQDFFSDLEPGLK